MQKNNHAQILDERVKYQKFLEKRGQKFTQGRKSVFDEAMNAHGHFTAEELVKKCKQKKRKVSRATIYRNLHDLLEAGIIRETAYGEKHHHFEHIYDEKRHHHARCIKCHDVLEFPDLNEDIIYQPFLAKKGFTILGHEMHFYGLCSKCQQ